jgi:DNA-binding MarR family transcriptional regulator/RimJ/RimL family protein N-acetyltransferase
MKKQIDSAPDADLPWVDPIRGASRRIVRELGFMKPTLADTDFAPSSVHALVEIGAQGSLTAVQLAEALNLEKSSVSRMVRKLIDAGELKESVSGADGRVKLLALTAKGRRTLTAIHKFGRQQVASALAPLSDAQRQAVGQGLATYAQALEAQRSGQVDGLADEIQIHSGYLPGAIGRAVEMHARYYARTAGFGQFFESQVASGFAEFASRLANPRNGLWLAAQSGRIVGTVVIDGEDMGPDAAHLRWFIVDDGVRGAGVGRRLLAEAMAFCDRHGFGTTQLWTFRGLDAARRLYEAAGFVLEEERAGKQWGSEVVEQRFARPAATVKAARKKS